MIKAEELKKGRGQFLKTFFVGHESQINFLPEKIAR